MSILGSHVSIAGGLSKSVERAAAVGCDCLQIFSKNNNQWKAKPIPPEEVQAFVESLDRLGIAHPIIHDSYLINLASPDRSLWRRSVRALVEELQRAELLGINWDEINLTLLRSL